MRINLQPAIYNIENLNVGLTKDKYDEAIKYLNHHCNAVSAQQMFDFESFFAD